MNPPRLPNPRRGEAPYLFADDIRCPKRLRQVLKTLRRWRLDGQYSVHETRLHPAQVRELAVELLDLVEQDVDALLVGRLSQRGHAPVYQWYPPRNKNVPRVGYRPASIPAYLHDGSYLIAYDITCPRRLQRVQRAVNRQSLFLQRSVYYYHGSGHGLLDLIARTAHEMRQGDDDLRLYPLNAKRDLWFLSGETPLAGAQSQREGGLWQRLLRWLRSRG